MTDIMARPIQILLVEDNPGDVRLTREALVDAKVLNKLNVVIDGLQALKYLRAEDEYKNATRPDLILLDLNLPKMDGRELLEIVKHDPILKTIPVIILTTSDDYSDINNSYGLGANCYITKPVDFEQFMKVMQSLEEFWFLYVKLPQ